MSLSLLDNITFDDNVTPDPLNRVFDAICAIPKETPQRISEALACKPYAISMAAYGSVSYDWVIMLYNGVVSELELQTGVAIYLPRQSEVDFILGQHLNEISDANDTVEI